MSRIGRQSIALPDGVKLDLKNDVVTVTGGKGVLSYALPQGISLAVEDKLVTLSRSGDGKQARAFHGLARSLVLNMIKGVSEGFEKVLELSGVGYKATLDGVKLNLALGFSHPVIVTPPKGISFQVEGVNKIKVIGIDKQVVGQEAANIRSFKKVEPYKGKGIKYQGEKVRRKAGKSAKTAGG